MARGGHRDGAGRPQGAKTKNKEGAEFLARTVLTDPEYQATLLTRARAGTLAPAIESMLWHYLWGKPTEARRDDDVFLATLLDVMTKHASSPDAQREIREVIEAFTTGGQALRAVA